MMNYGYARVSTDEQTNEPQIQELIRQGISPEQILTEKVSGSVLAKERSALSGLIAKLQAGDTLTVMKLDRLGRNAIDILSLIDELTENDIGVRVLNLGVDTSKASGRLFLTLLAGFAEFEREIIRERCIARLESAKANGILLGRRNVLTPEQRIQARQLRQEGRTVSEVARILHTSRMTAWRAMNSTNITKT
ncbi:recombinase family protein [Acetobacter orleanensis]|uniref:Transposase n=1 Tax=Acetobacter orleanensis TaxID=104099 RepID=A0A4Y3TNX1_9PROT|nr:recombinase family protein [Acetobacter orleanensis]KXV67070.1 resolvase [Acetobacter orleanensis]PCD78286.1 resolvase [Acetobacter orleanensis]GAN69350.1 DNA recombinase/resolvase [Acetobacter orleanensis JCM 7639]GBR25631.1 DNA-invertase [Acetobacter orleanensis NRIC 0473]GEB84046.1 transposase [Acetobacter orleanensis]